MLWRKQKGHNVVAEPFAETAEKKHTRKETLSDEVKCYSLRSLSFKHAPFMSSTEIHLKSNGSLFNLLYW